MDDLPSDPKIVNRLKNLPPFDEEEAPQVAPQTLTDPTEPQEPPKEPEPEPTVEAEGEAKTEEPAPVEEKDRTAEQFEKLKQHNAELKKQLEERKVPQKNALDALVPENPPSPITNVIPTPQQYPNIPQKEIKDVFASLTDDQGYVDTGLLKETLTSLSKAKEEAERLAKEAQENVKKVERRQDDFERKQVMKEVHALFPKLDPENADNEDESKRFDQNFYDLFQGEIIRNWTSVGTADPMKVAGKVSDILYGSIMRKADKEKAEQAELAKRNINATQVKPASTVSSFKDADELISATRKGSHNALIERLNKIGQ